MSDNTMQDICDAVNRHMNTLQKTIESQRIRILYLENLLTRISDLLTTANISSVKDLPLPQTVGEHYDPRDSILHPPHIDFEGIANIRPKKVE